MCIPLPNLFGCAQEMDGDKCLSVCEHRQAEIFVVASESFLLDLREDFTNALIFSEAANSLSEVRPDQAALWSSQKRKKP